MASTKPKTSEQIREEDLAAGRRAFIGQPVLNINALDPNDPRGIDDVIDRDIEDECAAQLHTEVNSADWNSDPRGVK